MTIMQASGEGPQAPYSPPMTADGKIDWDALKAEKEKRDAYAELYWDPEEKRAKQALSAKMLEDNRRAEEASLEKERLKRGMGTPLIQPLADPASITLEFAMASDTATVRLQYLLDPYLPSGCVVGFFGRGGSAKSTFLATAAATISEDASTLWVSVEEQSDWIKVRHIKSGGAEGTLAVVTAVASKKDAHGRVIGSNFNIYEHLEPAIMRARATADGMYNPPRSLRLVVLDTAVGLTTWAKGESPNDDASVKRLLGYLQHLAEKHDLTIAIIGHSNKGRHDHFADTVAGATAWTNSPRLSFVHARNIHEEFACVMVVAKSNLTTRFGASYSTEPVHTLHHREEGADSVLCRAQFGDVVWGEDEAMDLFESATKRPSEDDEGGGNGGGERRTTLAKSVMDTIVEMVHASTEPVTREMVEAKTGRAYSRRDWKKVDDRLDTAGFFHKVALERGVQNRVLYRRMP